MLLVWAILAITVAPLLGLVALALPRRWAGRLALVGPAVIAASGAALWVEARASPRVVPSLWLPALGIDAGLIVDRLAVFYLLLVGLVGLAIVQYGRAYFGRNAPRGFWPLMLMFMGAMAGLVLADNLVLFYLFWELTTVASALLIAGDGVRAEARAGAVQAFLVTGAGGLCLLGGILLFGQLAGTFDFSGLGAQRAALLGDSRHLLPLALLLVGALAKSAQFPFHFWLPGAMAAPTPVSAYLHSATMVQAGLVLVARLLPALGGSPLWLPLLSGLGLATFAVSGWGALRSWDLKRLLAHSTSAYLGLVTAYYGFLGQTGGHDDLMLIANHALYKSALFLLVGWIERVTGTRDLRTLVPERWVQHIPQGAVLFAIGVLAMAGAPLLLGFAAKELFLSALMEGSSGVARALAAGAAVLGSGLSLGYALKYGHVFFGRERAPLERGHPRNEVSAWLFVVPALLLVPQLVGGLAPRWLSAELEPGTRVAPGPAVWHHADALMGLSLGGYLLGLVCFLAWQPLARLALPAGLEQGTRALARTSVRAASRFSRWVQAGGHPRYVTLVVLAVGTAGAALARVGAGPGWRWPSAGTEWPLAWVPTALVLVGAGGALLRPARASKAISLGLVGFGVALFYALFRAPDLVLAQVLVESLSLVLALLAFGGLPSLGADPRGRWRKGLHAAVGLAVGLGMAALALGAAGNNAPDPAGRAELAMAVPQAHGRNAVNVILTDFRGGDTLGEIAVLAIAALGGVVLLGDGRGRMRMSGRASQILRKAAVGGLPATGVFAAYLLLRGHDAPGGGFTAGLVIALAFVLEAISARAAGDRGRSRTRSLGLLAGGLAAATLAAVLALAAGRPFFTHLPTHPEGPLAAALSTRLLFELGVLGVVVAMSVLMREALGRSER